MSPPVRAISAGSSRAPRRHALTPARSARDDCHRPARGHRTLLCAGWPQLPNRPHVIASMAARHLPIHVDRPIGRATHADSTRSSQSAARHLPIHVAPARRHADTLAAPPATTATNRAVAACCAPVGPSFRHTAMNVAAPTARGFLPVHDCRRQRSRRRTHLAAARAPGQCQSWPPPRRPRTRCRATPRRACVPARRSRRARAVNSGLSSRTAAVVFPCTRASRCAAGARQAPSIPRYAGARVLCLPAIADTRASPRASSERRGASTPSTR
jgi:hypothetical protein